MKYLVLLAVLLAAPALHAQDGLADVPSALPTYRQLVEEVMHGFTVTPYQPELAVDNPAIQRGKGTTIEAVMAGWIKAMQAGQYEAALGYWDEPSRAMIVELDRQRRKSPADWEREWRQLYAGKQAVLTHRVKYGRYWLVAYNVLGPSGRIALRETVALENRNGRWQLTQALADNAVMANWESDKTRVQRLANPMYKTPR